MPKTRNILRLHTSHIILQRSYFRRHIADDVIFKTGYFRRHIADVIFKTTYVRRLTSDVILQTSYFRRHTSDVIFQTSYFKPLNIPDIWMQNIKGFLLILHVSFAKQTSLSLEGRLINSVATIYYIGSNGVVMLSGC